MKIVFSYLKLLFILTLLLTNHCMVLYKELSNKKDILIVNYIQGCRFCKTLINYVNQIYSFIECNLQYDIRQRFSISRGKKSKIFSYVIANQASKLNLLRTATNQEIEFFITQNSNNSNIIISSSENLCLTNPISVNTIPYEISPALNNFNLMFYPCDFNSQNQEQEFYFENNVEKSCFKGRINLYYANTTTFLSINDINNINSNYPLYRFITYYADTNHLSFIPSSSSFDIELPGDESTFTLGNNFETIPYNSTYYCIYSSFPKNYLTSTFTSPFFNRHRCQLNSTFNMEYYIEMLNKVEFKFINVTLGNYLNSSFLAINSDVIFTNNTNNKVYRYNLSNSSFPSFIANLSFGNYSTTITIRNNPNYESDFQGLTFIVNNCNFSTYDIPFREKINNVTIAIINEADSNVLSTSYFNPNTNIIFTRQTNNQQYIYNVGAGNLSSFVIALHHGIYNISSTTVFDWTSVTSSINVVDYNSIAFNIVLREKTAQVTFSFIVSNYNNTSTNTCVFKLNTLLTLSLPNSRSVSRTITACTSTIVFTLYFGTWTITDFTLSDSALDSMYMNSNHSFIINSTNNVSFNISFGKLDNKVLHYIIPIGDGNARNLNLYDCGDYYFISYLHILKRHSNSLNLYLICKEMKTNNIFNIIGPYQYDGEFFYIDRHNINCGANNAIQGFGVQFDGFDHIRFSYNCIQISLPSGNCFQGTHNENLPLGNLSSINGMEIGLVVGYLQQFNMKNYSHFTTYKWEFTSCFINNNNTPYSIYRYFITSSLDSTNFKGISGLNITCNAGEGLVLIAYIHNGSAHQALYLCRTLSGSYGNLNQRYTDNGGWNVGGSHWIYFERQTLNCGTNGILNSLQLEYEDSTGNIRTRYTCYDYYNPYVKVNKTLQNTTTCNSNYDQIHINGFTYGDGINFINYSDIGGCNANYIALIPLV